MSAGGPKRAWLGWLLSHRLGPPGDWLLRRAIDSLVRAGSAESGRELVVALAHAPMRRQPQLRDAIARLVTPAARAAACEAWTEQTDPGLVEVFAAWDEVPGLSPRERVLLALHLGRPGRLDLADEGIATYLIDTCLAGGPFLGSRASSWIVEGRPPALLERMARHWASSRDLRLAEVIERSGYVPPPGHPARLLVLLHVGRLAPARRVSADEVPALLTAAADADPIIARRAREALAELERGEARLALCRLAVEGDERAEQLAVAAGFCPLGPHERALFLFVTRQWAAYEVLDFDGSLLRVAYEASPESVRRHLARRAQQAGRREFVFLLAGERLRPSRRLSAEEWQTLIDLLAQFREWPRLWGLVRTAPPARSADIVERLTHAGWVPASEADDFARLAGLVCGQGMLWFGADEYHRACWDRVVPGPVGCLAWHPSEPWLACVADAGSAVHVLRPITKERKRLDGPDDVLCLVVSADGRLLAGGSQRGHVYLWALPEAPAPRTLYGCAGAITQVALTPDGKTLVGLSDDFAQVWNLTEDDPECKPLEFAGRLSCLAISPDGEVLAVADEDGTVWMAWHLPHGELKDALRGHEAAVVELAFSRDGQALASRDARGQCRLWSLAPPRCINRFQADSLVPGSPDFEPDPAPVVSRRGCRQAVSAHGLVMGQDDGSVVLGAPPSRWEKLAQTPLEEIPLAEWEKVRHALAQSGLAEHEARALAFLDALLARRWRTEVQATDGLAGTGPYEIAIEEVRP
jgi:hypothetical protein